MSLIAKMYVEDKEITILDFKFRFTRATDEHGYPMGRPNGTVFEIIFETTADQSFMAWSIATDMTKHVKIVVSPVDGMSKSRIIELYDVHCVHFRNNFNGQNGEPMTTLIHLTPAIMIDDGYKVLDHYWKKTDLDAKAPVTTLNNDQEPSIMFLDWIHEDTEESLSEISYGLGASLKVQVNNPKGNEATISIEKEDGSDFENGKKKLTTTAFLDGNGFGKVSALNFLGEWASEDEELDFDNLIAYVEHAGLKKSSPKLKVKKQKAILEWTDSKGTQIKESDYGQKVNIALEVKNGEPKTCVRVIITKEDESEFEKGVKEIYFDVDLDKDNKAIIKDIEIEKIWMNFKNEKKDCLIATAVYNGVAIKKESPKLVLNPFIDIKVDLVKGDFVPLGISDYDGNKENDSIIFEYEIEFNPATELIAEVKEGNNIIYTEKITATNVLSVGKHQWKWDGFDNNGILDTVFLQNSDLSLDLTLLHEYKDAKGNKKVIEKKVTQELKKQKATEVKWVDTKIDKNKKEVYLTLRVNLKDGGAKGLDKGGDVPQTDVNFWGVQPINKRTQSFSSLEHLALDGLRYHLGRNRNHSEGKNISISGNQYEVFVLPIPTSKNSLDDVKIIFNTNREWGRSSNPGSISDIISLGANVIPERIFYNVGYIDYEIFWSYRNSTDADSEFKETAAHEIGHEIIKSFTSSKYSYKHKLTSTLFTQKTKKGEPNYPTSGEIDLMMYYQDEVQTKDKHRQIISEKDLLSIIWLTKLRIK